MRSTLLGLGALAIVGYTAWHYTRPAPVDPPPSPSRLVPVGAITELAPNLYLVPGGGCNTAVFVTSQGVVVVDTKYKEGWNALLAEVRSVTDKPITHVINSHRHPDHTEGNTQLPDGVKVLIHSTGVQMMRDRAPVPGGAGSGTWLGSAPVIVTERLTLFDDEDAVDVYHFGAAHTGGDLFVVFRSARVMHVGDVMPAMSLPSIVVEGGGSGATFAGVLERAGALPVDRIITGHGPVVPRSDFLAYGELNRLMLDHVRATMRFGVDKNKAFRSLTLPDKFKSFNLQRMYSTLDEIDRSIRPWWQRVW